VRRAAAVVTTANAVGSPGRDNSIEQVDRRGTLALLEAAKTAGVRQFIYTSAGPTVPANNPFIRCKRDMERAVAASGIPFTILQPAAFMEIHTGRDAGWDFEQGRARIAGSGRAPASYISIDDVAAFAAAALGNVRTLNRFLLLNGPEPLAALDAVAIAERVTGRRWRVQRVPSAILNAAGSVIGLFNPATGCILKIVASADIPNVVDMKPLCAELAIVQTTFEDYARRAAAPRSSEPVRS
jgi:NADH dehydrogenase